MLKAFGQSKPYIPAPVSLFWAWPVFDDQLRSDSLKITYGLLHTYTRDDRGRRDSRWVWPTFRELAELRGIPLRTFREHVRILQKLGLIMVVPRKAVDPADRTNGKTIFVKDLPQWWTDRDKFKRSLPKDIADEASDEELTDLYEKYPDLRSTRSWGRTSMSRVVGRTDR